MEDRQALRRTFIEAWSRYQAGLPLEPQQDLIGKVVALHPEYQGLLESPEAVEGEFDGSDGQSNPFLHMSLHIAVREQLGLDRPPGVKAAFDDLLIRLQDPHRVEHEMIECLAAELWQAQRESRAPDEQVYLAALQQLRS
ncbi:MAG: DUF1841 family protein [Gammaproteobacteria bacterium]|nr:DUF1841 family protein [Gammaproteobacteria bacterium]